VEKVIETLHHNLEIAQQAVAAAVEAVDTSVVWACHTTLAHAIMTDRARIPADMRKRLQPIIGRVLES
jgi:5'-methylthioadenosine phosphorylase